MIQIDAPAGSTEAYLARPDEAPHPGVLFFVDAIGLRDRTRQMADRIASWGYVVLMPHVFYREGTVADLAPTMDLRVPENRAAFGQESLPRVQRYTAELSDADTHTWVEVLSRHATGPYATTGYCMGARLAVRAAALHPDQIVAVGGFHGANLVDDTPTSCHRLVARTHAEYLFGHADHDTFNPAEAITTLEDSLTAAGLTATSAIYPEAPHGFTMADTSSYQEVGTERMFAELEDLLARTLGQ
ncbi:hypothetical protein KEM60_01246 [Austwickia sp. TVS 96-490-7B]|nr:hypothetical protein [Austwickia sp. TVS 96-490-7B]